MSYNKNYSDIIDHPRHVSKKHPPMSLHDRAAQFSPFAALTGYDDSVREAARLTENKLVLDDDRKADINLKLSFLETLSGESPVITVTYFIKDSKKQGGKYITVSGNFKRTDTINRLLYLTDNTKIPLSDIYSVDSSIFPVFYEQ